MKCGSCCGSACNATHAIEGNDIDYLIVGLVAFIASGLTLYSRFGLDPARFIATGVLIAILIDVSRLPTYAAGLRAAHQGLGGHGWALVGVGTLCAFAGAFLGVRYLKKATIGVIRSIVAAVMLLVGSAVLAGVLGS